MAEFTHGKPVLVTISDAETGATIKHFAVINTRLTIAAGARFEPQTEGPVNASSPHGRNAPDGDARG